MKTASASLIAFVFCATSLTAQYSYSLSTAPHEMKFLGGTASCRRGMFDPEAYIRSGNVLQILAQGQNNDDADPTHQFTDSFYGIQNTSSGWLTGSDSVSPIFNAHYDHTGCVLPSNQSDPIASPSVVKVPNDSRYFMAFVGGNVDVWQGRIYWAVSNDGLNWSPYTANVPNGPAVAILYPGTNNPCTGGQGFQTVQLAYENGVFYLYTQYAHPNGSFTTVVYRMDYNAANAFGVGSSTRDWYDATIGTWSPHGSAFRFADEGGSDNATGMTQYGFGAGDLKFDAGRQKWLHVWGENPATKGQETASLASTTWSAPAMVQNMASFFDAPPGGDGFSSSPFVYSPGLFYGVFPNDFIGSAQMWLLEPANYNSCGAWKTGIARAVLSTFQAQ